MPTLAVIQFATPARAEQRAPGYLTRRLAEAIADCLSFAPAVTVRNPLLTTGGDRRYLLLAKPLTEEQAAGYAAQLQADLLVSGLLTAADDELAVELMLYAADGKLLQTHPFANPQQPATLAAIVALILSTAKVSTMPDLATVVGQTLGTEDEAALLNYWAARDTSPRYGSVPMFGDDAFTLVFAALQRDPSYHRAAELAAELALDLSTDAPQPSDATLTRLAELQQVTTDQPTTAITANAYFSLGLRADERHDNRTALRLYQLALAAHPSDIAATAHLGDLHYRLGMRDEAFTMLQRAYELNPSDDHSAFLVARIHEQQERPDEALVWYARAAASRADFWQAHFYAADLLRRLHRLDAAVAEFQQTLAIDPQQAQTHAELGATLAELGRPTEALPHLEQAATALPNVDEIKVNIATVKAMLAE